MTSAFRKQQTCLRRQSVSRGLENEATARRPPEAKVVLCVDGDASLSNSRVDAVFATGEVWAPEAVAFADVARDTLRTIAGLAGAAVLPSELCG